MLKKAPVTVKSLLQIEAEAHKAGLSLKHVLEQVRVKGWRGFKAVWLKENTAPAEPAASYERVIERKAKALGMVARPGESYAEFAVRLAASEAASKAGASSGTAAH